MFDTPEEKAALAAAIEDAVSGLKSKNTELLAEIKKARKNAEITPEQLAEVEAERDKLSNDLQAANKQLKIVAAEFDKTKKLHEEETGFTQKLLIDNGLVSELTKHGITNPVHLKAAQAMLRSGVQIVVDGENRTAKVGDKALCDHIKEWATSDEGKYFVTAPNNAGGGAAGGGGDSQNQLTMKRSAFEAMNPLQKVEFSKKGGKLTQD